ncbi:MAG: methylmalonyl Co-A mutase-associated GTPase MeaB [Desulfobacterales bacterium]|nr:methylmalonyl Co-A mutase-associated GTPase MeaB [Desulfobacterales bacterium]MBF0395561.1 methylmalonyl Co-A mutase-associated GTPase MeaB [Desulfobacterales bacterium]
MADKNSNYYIDGILSGNRRILAKTITLIESVLPAHQKLAHDIINKILPFTGKSIRLGITGVPGVGKSTFIETLGLYLIKSGHSVAVLAVDPTSVKSGGSILADKTRMEGLSCKEKGFIRPSPSGGTLGGVARKTRETLLICEAAGFDVVIVETVGVGQSEIAVASMVDFFLVLMLANAGDELQGIKKGILEFADAIAINKADGDNIEKANKAKNVYENAFDLLSHIVLNSRPKVVTCSAIEGSGIENLWNIVLENHKKLGVSGELLIKRNVQSVKWMYELIEDGLKEKFYNTPEVKTMLPKLISDIEAGRIAPNIAAYNLLFFLDKTN